MVWMLKAKEKGRSSISYGKKSTVEQYIDKRSKRCSKKRR